MLRGIVGVPGAGKTSYAISLLLEAYAKKDRPIYTNINLKIPYDDYLRPLDIEDFHEFCENELAFFSDFRKSQSEKRKADPDNFEPDNYDDLLRNSGVLQNYGNALIFWDECQTDFAKEDPAYLRFCSYHRHYEGMDVYLITQNLSLVHRKYKAALDRVYFAVSSSKRLFSKTFKIKVFSDSKMYGRDLIETINFTPTKEIFNSYDSGHDKVDKSVFLKKIAPIIILVVLITSIWKLLIVPYVFGVKAETSIEQSSTVPSTTDDFREEVPSDGRTVEQMKQDALAQNQSGELLDPPPLENADSLSTPTYQNQQSLSRHLIRFQCSQTYCYFSGNRFTIPIGSMERFFEEFHGKILHAEMLNRDISIVTALVSADLYQMIESHKITSGSDNYGTHSETNTNGGTTMVPTSTTGSNPFSSASGI
jgi:hypothetical protein